MQAIQNGSRLDQILSWCEELKASDLHGQGGEAFTVRVDGQLQRLNPDEFPPFSSEEFFDELAPILRRKSWLPSGGRTNLI